MSSLAQTQSPGPPSPSGLCWTGRESIEVTGPGGCGRCSPAGDRRGRELSGSLSAPARLAGQLHRHSSLFILEHPPHSHVRNQLEPGVQSQRPGSRRPRCLDSAWVYCSVFLDRLAAFDRRTGKSVEAPFALWPARLSPNRCLAGGSASEL